MFLKWKWVDLQILLMWASNKRQSSNIAPKSRTLDEDDIWLSPTLIDTPLKSVFNSGDLNIINSVFEWV